MKLAVLLLLLAALAGGGLFILLVLQLRYRVTQRHLQVTLFGLCLRRVKLSDIEHVSKRQANWAEKWYNTLRPAHRVLVVRRRRGWFKDFVLTPKNRYVFKTELERAVAGLPTAGGTGKPELERGAATDPLVES